jgi:hypothetical protein
MRRYLVTAAAVALAGALAVAPALAGKGGNGHGNGKGNGGGSTTAADPVITPTPDPGLVGEPVWVSGCGFTFAPVVVQVVHPTGYVESYNVAMWSTGCMDRFYFVPTEAGSYTVNVLQAAKGNSLAVVATTSEQVNS